MPAIMSLMNRRNFLLTLIAFFGSIPFVGAWLKGPRPIHSSDKLDPELVRKAKAWAKAKATPHPESTDALANWFAKGIESDIQREAFWDKFFSQPG